MQSRIKSFLFYTPKAHTRIIFKAFLIIHIRTHRIFESYRFWTRIYRNSSAILDERPLNKNLNEDKNLLFQQEDPSLSSKAGQNCKQDLCNKLDELKHLRAIILGLE